ncbi:MAG: hypothetical protein M5R36_07345 [Deltaproteobacteria bacterium]|nr:hypothetical protein [Deltaproteobacteria bacterium]
MYRYFWSYLPNTILYAQDKDGDENWRVYALDVTTQSARVLTPAEKVKAQIYQVSPKHPGRILIGLNDRNAEYHDIYELDLATGERTLVFQNDEFAGFVTDDDLALRFAEKVTPDGGTEYFRRGADGAWESFLKISQEDSLTTGPAGFDKTGRVLYMMDSRGRDTGALFSWNLDTDEKKLIAESDKADIGGIMSHPTEKTIQAVSFNYLKAEWRVLDESVRADFDYLRTVADGQIEFTSGTHDDRVWILAYIDDDGPVRYYRYDRDASKAEFLFVHRGSACRR